MDQIIAGMEQMRKTVVINRFLCLKLDVMHLSKC